MNYSAYEKINLRGFLIDFFGILVPGLLFIIFSLLTLGWPIDILFNSYPSSEILELLNSLNTFSTIALSIFILMLSYITGTIFFRRDPKTPDKQSYNKCKSKIKDPENWIVRKEKDGTTDIQYPYRYLYEYLEIRNLLHLARLVPWKGSDPGTYVFRSKLFINILKTRLEFLYPDRCSNIIKNEAQIRLMSSLWYVTFSLIIFSAIGIILLVLIIFSRSLIISQIPSVILFPFLFSLFVLGNSYLAKVNIQKFFHYMRVREIVIVLETVYIASKEKRDIIAEIID